MASLSLTTCLHANINITLDIYSHVLSGTSGSSGAALRPDA
jgi:hypothetical protein